MIVGGKPTRVGRNQHGRWTFSQQLWGERWVPSPLYFSTRRAVLRYLKRLDRFEAVKAAEVIEWEEP